MSYAQLLDASKRLGTNRPSTSRAVASKPQARLSTSSLKLANLSAEDARILLGK
jgi:hypothetical protein